MHIIEARIIPLKEKTIHYSFNAFSVPDWIERETILTIRIDTYETYPAVLAENIVCAILSTDKFSVYEVRLTKELLDCFALRDDLTKETIAFLDACLRIEYADK